MTDLAYVEQRNSMRDSRERCLATIATAFGCTLEEVPREVQRAVMMHGHECFQIAIASEHDAHERDTARAPPKDGTYRESPTRVDRPFRRR